MLQSNLAITKYATRFKKVYNPPNPEDMIKYERVLPVEYTASSDGETSFILTDLVDALRIVQIEKQIQPVTEDDYSFNPNNGQVNLLNGVSLSAGETAFIIYAKLITS